MSNVVAYFQCSIWKLSLLAYTAHSRLCNYALYEFTIDVDSEYNDFR